jgi:hypothetical protein
MMPVSSGTDHRATRIRLGSAPLPRGGALSGAIGESLVVTAFLGLGGMGRAKCRSDEGA